MNVWNISVPRFNINWLKVIEKCFHFIFFWPGSKAEIHKTRDYGWNCCKLKKEEGIYILISSDITLSWCRKSEWQLNQTRKIKTKFFIKNYYDLIFFCILDVNHLKIIFTDPAWTIKLLLTLPVPIPDEERKLIFYSHTFFVVPQKVLWRP